MRQLYSTPSKHIVSDYKFVNSVLSIALSSVFFSMNVFIKLLALIQSVNCKLGLGIHYFHYFNPEFDNR